MVTLLKREPGREHPVVAAIGVAAILITVLLIVWARVAVHGTRDLEVAISEHGAGTPANRPAASPEADGSARDCRVADAVATGRWAAGFSP